MLLLPLLLQVPLLLLLLLPLLLQVLLLLLLLQLLMLLLLLAYGPSHQACELSMDFPHRIFSTIREGILCNGVPEAQAWPIVLIFPT